MPSNTLRIQDLTKKYYFIGSLAGKYMSAWAKKFRQRLDEAHGKKS